MLEQRLAGVRDDAMLLAEAREHQLEVGAALREARERDVLARMVEPVRVVAQVGDDVLHQLVVRLLAAVKQVDLLLQQRQELVEVDVLGVPGDDRVHIGPALNPPARVPVLTQVKRRSGGVRGDVALHGARHPAR